MQRRGTFVRFAGSSAAVACPSRQTLGLQEAHMEFPNDLESWVHANPEAVSRFSLVVSNRSQFHTEVQPCIEVVARDAEVLAIVSLSKSGHCKLEALYPASGNWIVEESHQVNSRSELHVLLQGFFASVRKA